MWERLKDFQSTPSDDTMNNIMFPVSDESIAKAESRIGRSFPDSLKHVWKTVGCGFVRRSLDGKFSTKFTQNLLGPSGSASAYLGEGRFSAHRHKNDKIPFFHTGTDDGFMVLDERQDGTFFVRYSFDILDKTVLAESIEDFLNKQLERPEFYLDIL